MVAFAPDFSKIEKQTLAYNTLSQKQVHELLYGGAKGGGKSVFGVYWSYLQAYQIAQKHFPKKPEFPVPVGFMGRKVGKDFKDTTLETWKRFIPADRYRIVGKPAEIIIEERVKILTGGLDRSEDVQKFNSAELAFFFIDQAEETSSDDISVLRAALRLTLNGQPLNYKGLFTANPRQCWLKNEFILNPSKHRKFVRALPGDNPLLPKGYIDTLKDAFKYRPELLEAYLHGSWDCFEGHDQVIKAAWLRELTHRRCEWPIVKHYLVCDPARFGDDETKIMRMVNSEIAQKWTMPYCSVDQIVNRMTALSHQWGGITCVIETTGGDIGAGVSDCLTANGVPVLEFMPNAASTKKVIVGINDQGKPKFREVYGNLRAEAWANAAEKLGTGILSKEHNMIMVTSNMYRELETQLCYPRYKFGNNGKTLIESKADLKKPDRMGRSPDDADCYVIALWAWDKLDAIVEDDDPTRYIEKPAGNPMLMG